MMQRLNARNALSLLAAAVALTACGGGDTGNTSAPAIPTQVAANTCATPPAAFTNDVWPAISGSCVLCHRPGAVAGSTRLAFTPGASAEQNYAILRSFAAVASDYLLSKPTGLPTHAGGKVWDAGSKQIQDLTALMPKLKETCSTEVLATGKFWEQVQFADNATVLQKASVLFQGRNPTEMEKAAVAGGGEAVLRQTVIGYMDNGPVFDAFLTEAGHVQFLVSGVTVFGNNRGLNANDYPPTATAVINNQNPPAGVRARVEAGVRFEPVNILKYIVKNDRDYREIVTAKYTVLNNITATTLGAQVQGTYMNPADDNEMLPAIMPNLRSPDGLREAAGVLVTHSFLDRFPSTDTNAHRHTINAMTQRVIGLNIQLLASRPLEDGIFRNAVTDNPACTVCHDVMDPMAGTLQNWAPNNRYRPNGQGPAADILPNYYKSTDFMDAPKGGEYYDPQGGANGTGDKWFRDRKPPGYGSTPMPSAYDNPKGAEWLGQQFAADPRFAKGAVGFFYKVVFQRDPLQQPTDSTGPDAASRLAAYNAQQEEFNEIAARFVAGGYKVKPLIYELLASRQGRASGISGTVTAQRAAALAEVGMGTMLSAGRLNRKANGVLGSPHAPFNNPFAGAALQLSGFDGGIARNKIEQNFTSSQVTAIDGFAVQNACRWVAADFAKPVATRLLFSSVTMADTPANKTGSDKIQATIVELFDKLWNQRVTTNDPEVQRMYSLLVDIYNDRNAMPATPVACQLNETNDANGMGRAWAMGLIYMVSDHRFLAF